MLHSVGPFWDLFGPPPLLKIKYKPLTEVSLKFPHVTANWRSGLVKCVIRHLEFLRQRICMCGYVWKLCAALQIWRIKTNEELDKLIKHKNIVNCVKAQRLSRFGHVQRMADTRTVKKIFKWKSLTKRSQGRPKYRWEDNIKQDICQMKVKNWIACVQDRGKWKDVVERGKTG